MRASTSGSIAPAIASVTARKPRSSLLSAAPCPAGQHVGPQGLCRLCPAGRVCEGATVQPALCSAGGYCPQGSPSVSPCPPGTSSIGGTSLCEPCERGKFSNVTGTVSCNLCDAILGETSLEGATACDSSAICHGTSY